MRPPNSCDDAGRNAAFRTFLTQFLFYSRSFLRFSKIAFWGYKCFERCPRFQFNSWIRVESFQNRFRSHQKCAIIMRRVPPIQKLSPVPTAHATCTTYEEYIYFAISLTRQRQ